MNSQLFATVPHRKKIPDILSFVTLVPWAHGRVCTAGDLILDWLDGKISVPVVFTGDPALPGCWIPILSLSLLATLERRREIPYCLSRAEKKRGSIVLVAIGSVANCQKLSEALGFLL